MLESIVQKQVMLAVGSLRDVRIFRNNVGVAMVGSPARPLRFGLLKGSSDLIGWRQYKIQDDDVGKTVAVFTSVEVKNEKGKAMKEQKQWLENVEQAGGIAVLARSADAARDAVTTWRPKA